MTDVSDPGRRPASPEAVDELFSYIESFTNVERGSYSPRAFRLDRMTRMLAALGDPHREVTVIHVAGSKGKGSVCSYIESVLTAAGYAVGRYASPHVSSYLERFSLRCEPAAPELVMGAAQPLVRYAQAALEHEPEPQWPTTFELLTALAFLIFREAGLTHAVVEVGLGGRLDATNVVMPLASLISVIELEHTEYLGTTLEAIAGEKAGIIKPGRPVFVQQQQESVLQVFANRAAEVGSPMTVVSEDIVEHNATPTPSGNRISLSLRDGREIAFTGRMLGAAQSANAALALSFLTRAFPALAPQTITHAMARARLPGRGELVPGCPPVLLDGAHTPGSVAQVAQIAQALCPDAGVRTLIFGCGAGKRHEEMARILAPLFGRVMVSRPGVFKPSNLPAIAEAFAACGARPRIIIDARAALREAGRVTKGLVVVTGSFYLMGEVREELILSVQNQGGCDDG